MPEQNQSLAGKTVLITGGARRVGAAIARELHAAGANLAIHYRKSAGDAGSASARTKAATGGVALPSEPSADPGVIGKANQAALGRFGGVSRRFQLRGEVDGITFIDSYDHLRTEVRAVLLAALVPAFLAFDATADRWSDAVIALLRQQHPGVLDEGGP